MNGMDSDPLRSGFFRQRRNLMALSLVLLVADIQGSPSFASTTLSVHPPFTIGMVLWIVWGYWLYRYYVYFRDFGDKGFRDKHRARLTVLVLRWAKKKFDTDPSWKDKRIENVIESFKKTKPGRSENVLKDLQFPHEWKLTKDPDTGPLGESRFQAIPVQVTLMLYVNRVKDEWSIQYQGLDQVAIEGFEAMKLNSRVAAHVLIHTRIFSEYYFPFLIALTPVVYSLFCLLRGET